MRRSPMTPGQSSHPTLISRPITDLVCTSSKISPRRDPGHRRSLLAVPKKHLRWKPATHTITIFNFQLVLHVSQVFPDSIGRITFTKHCPSHWGESVVNWLSPRTKYKRSKNVFSVTSIALNCVRVVRDCYSFLRSLQSWMTIKKTEISAQHEFLKPIYLCVHRGIILIYLDVHQKC